MNTEPDDTPYATNVRYCVLAMLCLLSFILYLDRVCIAQAAIPIQNELKFTTTQMSYVMAAFLIAYGLFEIPTGHWGDRWGSRGVLTRIVVWWSVFTMLTGTAMGFWYLVLVRFLFGAGEAGALPNAARVVARWFPPHALGRAQGAIVTSALVGGAVAPIVAQSLIAKIGWRWSFFALGIPGIAWAVVFYLWFRDNPHEHGWVNEDERQLIGRGRAATSATSHGHGRVPWGRVLSSSNVWLLGLVVACAAATTYLVFTWFPTYLQKGRSVTPEIAAKLSSLTLCGGALGSLTGGWLCDRLIAWTGDRRWSRSLVGAFAMGSAGLAIAASVGFNSATLSALCCMWAMFAIHVQLSAWWGVVSDVSGAHLGAIFGLVNSMGVPAGAASQILLARFVDWRLKNGFTGRDQWDPAFYLYAAILLGGAVMWLMINANKSAVGESTHLPSSTE